MNSSIRRGALVLAAAALLAATCALAAEPAKRAAKPAAKPDPAQDAVMAEMMKLGAPGAAHEKLKGMEGKWKAVQKSWYAPGEPTVSEGVAENRLILGGRFLEQHYQGTAMGQPFEGHGLTGYDNKKGEYTVFWVDNTSTSMMTGTGSMDAAGTDLTTKAMGIGPDGKPTELKMVTHVVDASRHVFSMYTTVDGKEQLIMEITYTRM